MPSAWYSEFMMDKAGIPILSELPNWAPVMITAFGAAAWVTGFWITLLAIFHLKRIGDGVEPPGILPVFVRLGVGVCLLSLPTVIEIASTTAWGANTSPFSYSPPSVQGVDFSRFLEPARYFFALVGAGAAIKGLLIWERLGAGDHREGFWKGLIHIISGGALWNFREVLDLFKWAFGLG